MSEHSPLSRVILWIVEGFWPIAWHDYDSGFFNKAELGPYLSIRAIHDNFLINYMNRLWYISKCTISVLGTDVAHFLVYKRILFKCNTNLCNLWFTS